MIKSDNLILIVQMEKMALRQGRVSHKRLLTKLRIRERETDYNDLAGRQKTHIRNK